MLEFSYEDDLPVEAIVARNMGDPDWEELIDKPLPMLAKGCTRRATQERDPFVTGHHGQAH